MEALAHNNIRDFVTTAGTFLDTDPVQHSVHLTAIDIALRGEKRLTTMVSLHHNGIVVGALTQVEARPLHVAAMPPSAAPVVADFLRSTKADFDALTGPRDRVDALRVLWREGGRETFAMRLYHLDELIFPNVPGEARLATPADDDLITEWWTAYVEEAEALPREDAIARMNFIRWTSSGHVMWLVDGKPVSWASSTYPVSGVARVGPVYTPPEHRRHGYAAAATAAISQWAYDEGAVHAVLTTDLANPTSNSIYQQIGYRPVGDWCEYRW